MQNSLTYSSTITHLRHNKVTCTKFQRNVHSSYQKFVRCLSEQDKWCCQYNLLWGTVITLVQHLVANCNPKRIKLGHGDAASTVHPRKTQGQPGNDAHNWCKLVLCRHHTTLKTPSILSWFVYCQFTVYLPSWTAWAAAAHNDGLSRRMRSNSLAMGTKNKAGYDFTWGITLLFPRYYIYLIAVGLLLGVSTVAPLDDDQLWVWRNICWIYLQGNT